MHSNNTLIAELKKSLKLISTAEKAEASRRFFPHGINCIGANASDIKFVIKEFQSQYSELSAEETLSLSEDFLKQAKYSEEKLLAFGLLNKFVKNNFDETLLERFKYWLEQYADNWALVDDLCIKTIYRYFLSRPDLIVHTQSWVHSNISWCRRASSVVWVKFIKRKIGKRVYFLDKKLIFKHCDFLLNDEDEFVQKGLGWLLKVTSEVHMEEVIAYIENNYSGMKRHTLRYAIEKLDKKTRQRLLKLS